MPPRKGHVQKRGLQRRQQILAAAVEVFSRNGFYGTPLSAVAERAGISTPGVLHHFPTKEALLVAVVEDLDQRQYAQWDDIASARGLSALRRFPRMAQALVDDIDLMRFFSVVTGENLHPDGLIHQFFLRRQRRAAKWIAQILETGQEDGEIRTDLNVQSKAMEILAFQEGLLDLRLLDPVRVPVQSLYEQYIEMVIRDIATAATSARSPVKTAARRTRKATTRS